MATLEERVSRLEGIIEQINERLSSLQWMLGLGVAWLTAWMTMAAAALAKFTFTSVRS
jgi:hypothetical protein